MSSARAQRARRSAAAFGLVAILLAGLAPAPGLAAEPPRSVDFDVSWTRPGVPGTFVPPAALRVGDEVTATPTVTGFEVFDSAVCTMSFFPGAVAWSPPILRARIGSDDEPTCAPWTFVVPPTLPGPHTLALFVPVSEFEQYQPSFDLTVEAGGVARAFTSNVPLLPWDVASILGQSSLHFGEAWAFPAPPDAETGCEYIINGSYLTGLMVNGDDGSCSDWTVTLPDIRPPALRSDALNGYPWQVWFHARWTKGDSLLRSAGELASEEALVDDADGPVTFASDRPAAVFAADDNPYFAYAGPIVRTPRIVGIETGTCLYDVKQPDGDSERVAEVALVDGSCAPLSFDVPIEGSFQAFVYILDDEGVQVAAAWTGGEIIPPLPEPEIVAPPAAEEGEAVEIDASTDSGTPLEYEIEPVLEAESAGAALAGTPPAACEGATGTFVMADADRSATATCTFHLPGTYLVTATFRDPIGTVRQTSTTIEIEPDGTAPMLTGVRPRLVPDAQLGTSAIPLQIAWAASDAGSGVDHLEVARQTDGGPWTVIDADATGSGLTVDVYRGHRYRFKVRALDRAGNATPWAYTATFGPTAFSEANGAIRYGGSWSTTSSSAAYGGAFRSTSRLGASAAVTFTGRSVAWVAPRSPIRGWAKVYLDGKLIKRVNLFASSLSQRREVFAWNWSVRGTHTVRIVNEATSGRPRIDLDAIVVLD